MPPKGRLYHSVHRWSGRAAILLTLPVAYHCVFLLSFDTHSPRVLMHSLLGSALYGAVVAKVLIVRSTRFAPWVLPVAGGLVPLRHEPLEHTALLRFATLLPTREVLPQTRPVAPSRSPHQDRLCTLYTAAAPYSRL